MINKTGNIQTFLGCDAAYEDAKIVLFGVPYDSTTTNRPGTRFAPAAMRSESYGLETFSPYQNADLENVTVYDAGELEVPFGRPEPMLEAVENAVAEILEDDKIPLMIGGEHLITLGAVRACAAKYPDLHIIHFDAHTDLREEYLGEELSHSTVMRHCLRLVDASKIYQFGIRSGTKEEFQLARTLGEKPVPQDVPIYLTLDLDVLDPSALPGTGTPEAGGWSFLDLLETLLSMKNLNIIGCDIMELAPNYDHSGISTATACKILRELILILTAKEK